MDERKPVYPGRHTIKEEPKGTQQWNLDLLPGTGDTPVCEDVPLGVSELTKTILRAGADIENPDIVGGTK